MKNRKLASIAPILDRYLSPNTKAVMTDGYTAYKSYFKKKVSHTAQLSIKDNSQMEILKCSAKKAEKLSESQYPSTQMG